MRNKPDVEIKFMTKLATDGTYFIIAYDMITLSQYAYDYEIAKLIKLTEQEYHDIMVKNFDGTINMGEVFFDKDHIPQAVEFIQNTYNMVTE